MSFELAQRLTEAMMALCFLQQGAEHMRGFVQERVLHLPRMALSALLLAGVAPAWTLLGLLGLGLALLRRFDGPYNGGTRCAGQCPVAGRDQDASAWDQCVIPIGNRSSICDLV